ncbi:flippase-like domain-containing protein [Intrasporangium calvum]|uniref:Flippase-like domain-containing protein n=1 Tax=Intrasporangium calvum TaxID=53358 RepID=A0ABT5GFE3_9MICO|nr:lysylphosphatidylglycerol synthase transmembrane domain-containing protein [Intrasporangium calvum]MDC5696968.1 flippase-like domain-containing protein [Intrasporangium calvum]
MTGARIKKVVQFLVGTGLAVFLLWWGLPRIAHTTWTDVWRTLSGLQFGTVIGLTGLMISGLWLVTFLYTGSLKGLTHAQAMIVNACGSSIGNLLPGGGAAGVVVTYKQLRSWGFLRRDISTMVIVTGVWNVLARVVLPVVGILAILIGIGHLNPVVTQAAIMGALIGLAVVLAFWGTLASEDFAHKLGARATRVWRRLRGRKAADTDLEKTIVGMRHDIIEIVRYGWLEMTYGLVGFFGVYYILFWFCLNSMGVQMPFAYMFGAYTVGRLLTAVGITPGGLGVTEAGTAAVLVGWGADPAQATAGVVLFSLYTHFFEVPLGVLGWVIWSLSPKKIPADAYDDNHEAAPDPLRPARLGDRVSPSEHGRGPRPEQL